MRTFRSGAAFAAFLTGRLPAQVELAVAGGLHDAARMLQQQAKGELGRYQGEAGGLPAWAELSERTQRERAERGLTPNDPLLATGGLSDHIDAESEARKAVVGVPFETIGAGTKHDPVRNVGAVAIDLELGTSRMPARSFLARAAVIRGEEAANIVGQAAGAAVADLRPVPVNHDEVPF